MNFETVKKSNKPKIIMGLVVLLILTSVVMFVSTRAKYRSIQSVKLANGTVKLNQYDFKIMAIKQSEDGTNYTDIDTMPESGYVINEEKSYCTTDNKIQEKGKLKTIDGNHVMIGLSKNDKCYIWFDKKKTPSEETLAKLNVKNIKSGTPDFSVIATEVETEDNNGIFMTDDPMYKTTDNSNPKAYYWRGATTSNHVIFDNKCWRIVRINGDGSVRLIYNGTPSGSTCLGNGENANSVIQGETAYNASYDDSSYVGWTYILGSQRPSTTNPQISGTASPLKIALESWYSNNILAAAKNRVIAGYFCNDRNTKGNVSWVQNGKTEQYYAAYQRLHEGTKTPTLSCPAGDVYQLSVGMITADEVQFAGASGSTLNTAYYLYNGQYYLTMSPYQWYYSSSSNQGARMFIVNPRGSFESMRVNGVLGVRPVINLRSDVAFNSGSDGTQNNPYIVQ